MSVTEPRVQVPADGAGAHVARGLRAVPPLPRGPGQQVLLQRQQHLLPRGLLQVRCHGNKCALT